MADPVSLAASCVQPLCECLNATGVSAAAGREVGSFAQLKSNRRSLGKAVEGLRPVETTVRARVAAEINRLNVCDPQVQAWLNSVDGLQLDAIGEEYDQLMQSSCLCQFTTNAARRRRLGKRLVETLDEVKRLAEEGGQFKTFGIEPPPEFVERQPQIKTFGMERMLGQLHDLFDKAESNIIGVWGQGGVGKTTLLHVFNNDLEAKAGDYQVVILIEVSNSEALNTVDIQQTISDRLNLPWNEAETVDRRAKFLVKALARKRYVVLLDDVRKKFRLEDVGIPTPDAKSKSKLILTSRYQEVCYHMGAQRSLIEMQVLDKDAAWDLFLSKLSTEALKAVESPDVHNAVRQHAMAITQICGGLPLALNVIGMAVAGLEEPREWLSALNAIKANMVDIDGVDEMFARLKYSFDRLTLTQQQCFLYCTLFPEYGSISKEQLVDYWLAEGFLLENCDRGRQIIQSLISACLLQASSSMSSKVKMHHIIRRLGLWLVNKAQEKFIVQAGMALESTPSLREWKEATRISIMSNKIMGLSFSPKCRKLTTLLVQNNQELNKLSSGFFKYMSSLRVLDLSNTAITSLPECDALVALQHLNLSHTHIMRLPERLWLLKELRHLDLSVTFALEDTFDNCSKLHKLRVLNLFRSHYGIRDVDDLNLDSLKALLFLGITIYAEDVLRKLNKTHPLAKSTHRLNLKYCADMRTIKVSELNHMVHLEELYVESCYDLNTLVADAELMSSSSCLQILTLSVLPSLEYVTVAPMPHHFQNIRKLTISNCPKLLNVSWVLRLELLERLVISHSDEMLQVVEEEANGVQHDKIQYRLSEEQIIHSMVEEACNDWENGYQNMHKSEGENGTMRNCFPRLRSIVLTDLKKLTSICQPRDFHCLETIRVEDCPILRCIPLSRTYKCAKLKQICGSFVWWEGLQWEDKEMQTSMENKYFIPI